MDPRGSEIASDPRLQALRRQQPSGRLDAAQLRTLGYDVPDGYHFVWGGRAGYGALMDDKKSLLEKAAPYIAIGAGTVGGLGAAGVIPGFGGGAAAGGGAGAAGTVAGGAASGVGAVERAINGAQDGGSLLSKVLTGLKNYGPLALAGGAALKGMTAGRSPAEEQLNEILGMAKSRIEGSEPLYQDLSGLAREDASLARTRRAQSEPLLQALTAMTHAQMPDYTKGRG